MLHTAFAIFVVVFLICFGVFAREYIKYDRIITKRMSGQIFSTSAKIFARPITVHAGDPITPSQIAASLRRAGYLDGSNGVDAPIGTYRVIPGGIEVRPGAESYHSTDGARIVAGADGRIQRVSGLGGNAGIELDSYELEPELVTALFQGQERTKRQLLTYDAIPKVMVDAVLAIEDRKFFEHGGINWWSLMGSFITDLRAEGKRRGGSTITMQVSRGFFLTQQKTYRRKLTEMLIAVELEQKFNKQQIFELYANQVYLGQRGSYSIPKK